MSVQKPKLSDLSQSIFASLGLPTAHNTLNLAPTRRACLLLVDGLGLQAIAHYGHEFPIFAQLIHLPQLESHFPTTTVTNLTSLGTGVLPGIHGMLGYTVRIPGTDRLLNALKWDEKIDPLVWQSTPTLFEQAKAAGFNVTSVGDKRYEKTGFTEAALRGATYLGANHTPELVSETVRALAEPNSFAYLYTNIVDNAGHNFGVGSEQWLVALKTVADLITRLCNELPRNTSFYITADHGMVNAGHKVILGQENQLMNDVTLVGGEPRMRHIYLTPGSIAERVGQWRSELGETALVYSKSEAIELGLFGETVSEESAARIGDLIAIAQGDLVLIDPTRIEKESAIIGQHGGVTAIESEIPLLRAVI